MSAKELSAQHKLFCTLLAADPKQNKAQAYRGVYPECKGSGAAAANANRLLKRANVAAYFSELDAKANEIAADRFAITAENVAREKSRIAYFDPRRLFHADGIPKKIHELDDDTAAAITSFKVMVKSIAGPEGSPPTLCEVIDVSWEKKTAILDQLSKQIGQYEKDNKQRNGGMDELLRAVDGATRGLPVADEEDDEG